MPAQGRRRAALKPSLAVVARRFLFVGALILLDLWSKAAVFEWLQRLDAEHSLPLAPGLARPCYPLAGDWLALMLQLNPGAAFGQFDEFPYLLIGGRVAAGLFLGWLVLRSRTGRPVFNLALVLVLAGALGNLYDNFLRADRSVRDFLHFSGTWPLAWDFPAFNVADSCITVGAIGLAIMLWREPAKPVKPVSSGRDAGSRS